MKGICCRLTYASAELRMLDLLFLLILLNINTLPPGFEGVAVGQAGRAGRASFPERTSMMSVQPAHPNRSVYAALAVGNLGGSGFNVPPHLQRKRSAMSSDCTWALQMP